MSSGSTAGGFPSPCSNCNLWGCNGGCSIGNGVLPSIGANSGYISYGRGTPHTCPVCQGRQMLAADFYVIDDKVRAEMVERMLQGEAFDYQQCKSCLGTGVVWG